MTHLIILLSFLPGFAVMASGWYKMGGIIMAVMMIVALATIGGSGPTPKH